LLLGGALVSCGGLTDDLRSESSDGVVPGQADDEQPSESVEEEPAVGGGTGESGTGSDPKDPCSDVCQTLEGCAEEPLTECHERCEQSVWVAAHDTRCLALRVYWIDEEGCGVMLDTYEHFEPDDDCAD